MRIKSVNVYVHWSVLLIGAVMLLGAIRKPLLTLVALASYFSVLLIHEVGHMMVAHARGCEVFSIELYPICGFTHFQTPWSRFDHAVIAWGGVLAQSVVGIPIVAWVSIFGYTRSEPVNAALALLGFFSLGVAILNLIPAVPLDGAIAWSVIPELVKRAWKRRRHRSKRRY